MYTWSNATQDWTLSVHVSHTCKGFSAREDAVERWRERVQRVNASVYKPEAMVKERFCRDSGFGRVNPEVHHSWSTALGNNIHRGSVPVQHSLNQWESRLLPGASHTHRTWAKTRCVHTAELIIHRVPGILRQDFPPDTAPSPELVFCVLVAADPRTVFRRKSVFS